MTGKTHQMIGITSGLIYFVLTASPVYNPATFAGILVSSSIGALIPDLDQPTAKIWDYVPYGNTIGKTISPFIEHRNISHSIIGGIIFVLLFKFLFGLIPESFGMDINALYISFVIGFISHIVSDMITVEGVPLFFPYHLFMGFPPRPLHGIRIVSGKWFENLILFPLVNIALVVFITTHYQTIKLILFK